MRPFEKFDDDEVRRMMRFAEEQRATAIADADEREREHRRALDVVFEWDKSMDAIRDEVVARFAHGETPA